MKKNNQVISLHLPPELREKAAQMAAKTKSYPLKGKNTGKVPSVVTLLRRILEDDDLSSVIVRWLNGRPIDTAGQQTVLCLPASQEIATATALFIEDNKIVAETPYHEGLNTLIKSSFYRWDREQRIWYRRIRQETDGLLVDRCAELGATLLQNGFPVIFPNAEIRQAAISGEFVPEKRRWIRAVKCQRRQCFQIVWRYPDDLYDAALKISGSEYKKPFIYAPADVFDQVRDFAEHYDFAWTATAQKLAEAQANLRDNALIADIKLAVDGRHSDSTPDLTAVLMDIDADLLDSDED